MGATRPEPQARQQRDKRAGDTRTVIAAAAAQEEPPADKPSKRATYFDELAVKALKRGNKYRPEPPTLIAKVCEEGGELWLGGLPTEHHLPPAPNGGYALQVCCMDAAPEDRVIADKKKNTRTRGVTMPNVILIMLNMDNAKAAAKEWPSVSKLVVKSLRQGDNAYVHCMAGVHRAGAAGAMLRAHLQDETLDEALAAVKRLRCVEPERCLVKHPRCRDMVAKATGAGDLSRPVGWATATKLIHAIGYSEKNGAPRPVCHWSQGSERESRAPSKLHVYGNLASLRKIERAEDICGRCVQNLPASMLREARMQGFCNNRNIIASEATSFRY